MVFVNCEAVCPKSSHQLTTLLLFVRVSSLILNLAAFLVAHSNPPVKLYARAFVFLIVTHPKGGAGCLSLS